VLGAPAPVTDVWPDPAVGQMGTAQSLPVDDGCCVNRRRGSGPTDSRTD